MKLGLWLQGLHAFHAAGDTLLVSPQVLCPGCWIHIHWQMGLQTSRPGPGVVCRVGKQWVGTLSWFPPRNVTD